MCEELKPCPFCQSKDLRYVQSGWIKCNRCGTRGPIDDIDWPNHKYKEAEKRALQLWNTRHEPEEKCTCKDGEWCANCVAINKHEPEKECHWDHICPDGVGSWWESTCGLNGEKPEEKYCHECGGKIVIHEPEEKNE